MKPEAAYFLAKARKLLSETAVMVDAKLYDAAGRTAYLAGFHAAQGLISGRTGRSVKTHRGVHAELYRLTKDEPSVDADLRSFLGVAYNLKSIADYKPARHPKFRKSVAREAIKMAERFVMAMAGLIQA